MASASRSSPTTDNPVKCVVCKAAFNTLQECLGHELTKHSTKPQKKIRKCLDAITKQYSSQQGQEERRLLQSKLNAAPSGQHLRVLLDIYSENSDALFQCFNEVQLIIGKAFGNRVMVHPFGSMVTGLALRGSDIDLYLEQKTGPWRCMPQKAFFNKINGMLQVSNCFENVIPIRHARVPIIRCKNSTTNVNIDINMSSPYSIYNSRFFYHLVTFDERIRELFLFLKIWTKTLMIIGSGSMTSYCLMTMICYYLQQHQYLPSMKKLQSRCPQVLVGGINFGYSLQEVPPLPEDLTTLQLITNFFKMYSHLEFEKFVLCPYLAKALSLETAFTEPGAYPEYEMQVNAVHAATGDTLDSFQNQRCVCVQDPFELQHNVGQSISETNLIYIRKCFGFAAIACNDNAMKANPAKLYDYLLYGLAHNLLQHERIETAQSSKKRKVSQTLTSGPEIPPQHRVKISPVLPDKVLEDCKTEDPPKDSKPSSSCTENVLQSLPMHVHIMTPTNADLKALAVEKVNLKISTFYYWAKHYSEAIRDMLKSIYNLEMTDIEPTEPRMLSIDNHTLPSRITWKISTKLDTWTSRQFDRCENELFFPNQIKQTDQFKKTRSNPSNLIDLKGHFSLIISPDFKEIRIELEPMPDNLLGLQKHSPLTKFFKSLKNMLCNYSYKKMRKP